MKKLSVKVLFLAMLGGAITLTSCNRENEIGTQIVSAEDNAQVENEEATLQDFVEIEALADPNMGGKLSSTGNLPTCATKTYNQQTKTLTIDFGTTDCLCKDGNYRRGKIMALFNGKFRTPGSSVKITVDNYFVNGNQHLGERTITWNGIVNGYPTKTVVVKDAEIIIGSTTVRQWNSTRTVSMIAGFNTMDFRDDVFSVTGSASGVNRRGVNFTATIDQPLKKILQIGCARHFVAGVITVSNSNNHSMVLNYDPIGGEPCDNIAEVTINGRTKRIVLR